MPLGSPAGTRIAVLLHLLAFWVSGWVQRRHGHLDNVSGSIWSCTSQPGSGTIDNGSDIPIVFLKDSLKEATSMAVPQKTPADTAAAVDVEETLAQIEKGQQLAGHFPEPDDMDRARRILTGEITQEQAFAEIREKYNLG